MAGKRTKSIIAVMILAIFCLDSSCFGLGPAPASQNAFVKRSILPVLAKKIIRVAESDYDRRLLKANDTSCVLLSSDRYLVTPEVAGDNNQLIREITGADIKAIVQIIQTRDSHRYDQIRDFVNKNFPPAGTGLSEDQYVRDTLALAFKWLCLLEKGRETISRSEIPADVRPFVEEIEPLILKNSDYLFTVDFWNAHVRSLRIRRALKSGMVFYEPATAETNAPAGARTCLVLDADDVLWTGLKILDVSAVTLSPRHLELQRAAKRLKETHGVRLAINSKNNLSTVEKIFAAHPEMPLALSDFSAVRVNARNKAANMRSIAQELDVSPREMVFVDDSIDQRAIVKNAMPEVVVLDIPADPDRCRDFLDQPGVFGRPVATSQSATDDEGRLATMAQRFREKKNAEGINIFPRHDEIITGILRHLGENDIDPAEDPEKVIANAFRAGKIRRFLEIGCGDCSFLAALSDAARDAGVALVGIDHDPQPLAGPVREALARNNVTVLTGDAAEMRQQRDFDVIAAAGVMSLWGAYPEWQLAHAKLHEIGFRRSLLNAYDLINASSRLLSDNPRAAIYANSIGSILMLNRMAISKFVDISVWDDSRKPPVESPRIEMGEALWSQKWVPLWNQAATFAVMTKKRPAPPVVPATMVQDETARRDNLIEDLLYNDLKTDAVFEIEYDVARISPEQREIVEAYIDRLAARAAHPENIKRRPFSTSPGSEKPLISVRYTGEGFTGNGRIDIGERELQKSLVRITPMINIALAASTIPDCKTKEEVYRYTQLIRYIENQYESITGGKLALPGSPEALIAAIRNIPLPRAERIDPAVIDEYNRLAKAALTAA